MSVTYTITGGTDHLAGNTIELILTGTGMALKNYKLAVKVSCTGLISPVQVEEIIPNASGVAKFNISGLLDEPLDVTFDYPATGVANPHDILVRLPIIDIGEVWTDDDDDRQESWAGVNLEIRVISGKLRPYELALLNDAGKSFKSEFIDGGRFLTHLPKTQKVAPHQIPLLWFMTRWSGSHAATAKLQYTTSLGESVLLTNAFTFWSNTGLVDFAVNPLHWSWFVLPDGVQITSYEFWLSDGAGDISEHFVFQVDNNYYEKSFICYYLNPLSVVENIWLTGEFTESLKIENENAYRPLPVGYGSKQASKVTLTAGSQRVWDINTGYKSVSEMRALRDFLEAKQRWIVDPENTSKLIPVYIESGDYELYNSMPPDCDIPNLNIKFFEAH